MDYEYPCLRAGRTLEARGRTVGLSDSLSFNKFNRVKSNIGVLINVDLGIPFPVSEISFYPLDFGAHVDLYLKGYELFANDGSPENVDEGGQPLYTLLDAAPSNPGLEYCSRCIASRCQSSKSKRSSRRVRVPIRSQSAFGSQADPP